MKLATYKDGSRDGQLVVVSRDLSSAHYASGIATRLQQVLDDWNFLSPQLEELSTTLNHGKARHAFPFDPRLCMAPLPRAGQWVSACAYLSHEERLHPAGDALPETLRITPQMSQRGGDDLHGATDPILCQTEAFGIDFGAGLAVVTGDLPMGCTPEAALEGIRLLVLANAVHLRHLEPAERARRGGVQSQPATAFSPVAVTPDELGTAWQGGRVHLKLDCARNGKRVGLCETGPEMHFHFGQLLSHLCTTRRVRAGSLVGSGTVSNRDASHGQACIAEKRALETLADGAAKTEYLRLGDTVRIDMKGLDGESLFGAIDQDVAAVAASGSTP